eukprot:2731711-Amphidinium_carterae.1
MCYSLQCQAPKRNEPGGFRLVIVGHRHSLLGFAAEHSFSGWTVSQMRRRVTKAFLSEVHGDLREREARFNEQDAESDVQKPLVEALLDLLGECEPEVGDDMELQKLEAEWEKRKRQQSAAVLRHGPAPSTTPVPKHVQLQLSIGD